MRSGAMDRRVTIEQPTETQDTFGEFTMSWTVLDAVWAEWVPVSGREQAGAVGVTATRSGRFRIRYRSDVTTKMRVVGDDGVTYGIEAIAQIGRREGLELSVAVLTGT